MCKSLIPLYNICCACLIWVSIQSILCSGAFGAPPAIRGMMSREEMQPKIDAHVKKWQEMFGPVNFHDELLFDCMVYLHPQAKSSFQDFKDVKLANYITWNHERWRDTLFKDSFRAALEPLTPSKYYVNEGRSEASLLYWELEFSGSAITIQEAQRAFFLLIRPKDFNVENGIEGQWIAQLLFDWVQLKYKTTDEVIKAFRLPDRLKLGEVFTNCARPDVVPIISWENHVIGFVSKQGICLMLFKADGGRADAGFVPDFDWLNKGLLKQDGKTLAHPPALDHKDSGAR